MWFLEETKVRVKLDYHQFVGVGVQLRGYEVKFWFARGLILIFLVSY